MNIIFKVTNESAALDIGFIKDAFLNLSADPSQAKTVNVTTRSALRQLISREQEKLDRILNKNSNSPARNIMKQVYNNNFKGQEGTLKVNAVPIN